MGHSLGVDLGTTFVAAAIASATRVAGQQLARWQLRASHPATTRAVRDAAEVLVRTCEELLTQVGTE